MVTRGTNAEQDRIQANNFGGLNTYASETNLPVNQSPLCLNVDFNVNGIVSKRKGTKIVLKEDEGPVYSTHFTSNSGRQYVVARVGTRLKIYRPIGGRFELLRNYADVFPDVPVEDFSFVHIPGEEQKVLMLQKNSNPVQWVLREFDTTRTRIDANSSIIRESVEKYSTYQQNTWFYDLDKEQLSEATTVTTGADFIIVASPANLDLFPDAVVINMSWQWCAESLYWEGQNFYNVLTRNPLSQHVALPPKLISDNDNKRDYSIWAAIDSEYGNFYDKRARPLLAYQYSLSDGADFNPREDKTDVINPSPFFLTFGRADREIEIPFTQESLLVAQDRILLPEHGLYNRDIVFIEGTDGEMSGITPGTSYFVRRINANVIELYTDADLTTQVVLAKNDIIATLRGYSVNYITDELIVPAHGYTVGSITRVVFEPLDNFLPEPLSETEGYYLFAIDANRFEVYYDSNATIRLAFSRPRRYFFEDTQVNAADDTLTFVNHLVFDGDIAYFTNNVPTGLTANTEYYLEANTPNILSIYANRDLTGLVNITGTTGDFYMNLSGGRFVVREDAGEFILRKDAFIKAAVLRFRELRFNNGTGIRGADLDVYVNGELWTQNTDPDTPLENSYYLYSRNGYVIVENDTTTAFRIGFNATEQVGLAITDEVVLVNKETRFTGDGALQRLYGSRGYAPYYGLGFYANYYEGDFPTCGDVIQGRLALSGFSTQPGQVAVSAVGPIVDDEYLNYFQVTDDLDGILTDPLDAYLPDATAITAVRTWERSLFVFGRFKTFRLYGAEGIFAPQQVVQDTIAHHGCVNARSTAVTSNALFFLSDDGVFDVRPLLESNYDAAEISKNVRNKFFKDNTRNGWLGYDSATYKLYVGINQFDNEENSDSLLVFATQIGAWSEYASFYRFRTYMSMPYIDQIQGKKFVLSEKTPCFFDFLQMEYDEYIDRTFANNTGSVEATPNFASYPTYAGTLDYPVREFLAPIPVDDINVYLNEELVTNWTKVKDNIIRFSSDPGNGTMTITPNVGWFGNVLIQNLELNTLPDFGDIDFESPCSCLFDPGYGDPTESLPCLFEGAPGDSVEVGMVYPAVYLTPLYTMETFANLKRLKHFYTEFQTERSRYSLGNIPTNADRAEYLHNYRYTNSCLVAVIYQEENNVETKADVFQELAVPDDQRYLGKHSLQGIGYGVQGVFYSMDAGTWLMSGYQFVTSYVGDRYISGE